MKLKGGQPLWPLLSPPRIQGDPLSADEACDVLVIGSGITGALIAYHLAAEKINVVVIDRREVASGSTPASTSLVQYDIDTPLVELRRRIGADPANAAYRACCIALDDMQSLVDRLHMDCDLIAQISVYLACRRDELAGLREEAQARREIGIEVQFLDERELLRQFALARPGAIVSARALQLDPWRLTQQLLVAARGLGARIYPRTTLLSPGPPSSSCAPCTDGGHRINARHLVFATGYETPEEFPKIASLCRLTSTYALATEPMAEHALWPRRALIWDTGDPYLYARTTSDQRAIIGGEDEPFANAEKRDALIPSKTAALLHKFQSVFPLGDPPIATAWAGTFAQTENGLPYIGTTADYPNCHFALGYGGNGITFSLIAAQIIRDAILGRRHPAAALFAFDRPH